MATQNKSNQKKANQKKAKPEEKEQNNPLSDFCDNLIRAAESFGFEDFKDGKGNGKLRDCIHVVGTDKLKQPKEDDKNFWFGFVREDQNESGRYGGLSFVVFPESNGNTNCVVSIGIGSSTTADGNVGGGSLGPDMELAAKLSFVRSFRSLTNAGNSGAHFFFKLDFTETSNPTPGLKEALEDTTQNYDPVMVNTVSEYDHKDRGGLLPAAMLVNYSTGYDLIVSWLAQYAALRNWSSYKKGTFDPKKNKAIEDAIKIGKIEKESISPKKVLEILKEKRFIVLQGAPGCGKTWTAKQVAALKESGKDFFKETRFIQFHAETTYADFIYGIKPILNNGNNVAYEGNKGVFLKILDSAINAKKDQKDEKYLLIIDEFNRANLANVLGPVFYLFEQNNGGSNNLRLNLGKWFNPDSGSIEDLIYYHIPDNLYVIATMNTADKSLAVVDFALRRRFAWITLRPHTPDFLDNTQYVFDNEFFGKINSIFDEYATDEELNLQPGQSYFIYPQSKDFNKCRKDTIQYGIMPLVKEYISEGYLLAAKDTFAQLFYDYGVVMYE